MRKQTHPQAFVSLIQTKDGSFVSKRWLYFRPLLRLEIDMGSNPIWKKEVFFKRNNVLYNKIISTYITNQ